MKKENLTEKINKLAKEPESVDSCNRSDR